MPSQDPRAEVRAIQDEIDQLNRDKQPLQIAWERESKGRSMFAFIGGDEKSSTLNELREVNKRLELLYGQRHALLSEYPDLQREFGRIARTPTQQRPWRTETRAAKTAAERHLRKVLMHPGFKAWCAAQRPQVKGSLENWENQAIRARFLADQAPTPPGTPTAAVAPPSPQMGKTGAPPDVVTRGPIPKDFNAFLIEMDDRRANRPYNVLEDYWQSSQEIRDLYVAWRQNRA